MTPAGAGRSGAAGAGDAGGGSNGPAAAAAAAAALPMDMGTQGAGRKRLPNRERLTAEDEALNQIAREVGAGPVMQGGGARSCQAAVRLSECPRASAGVSAGGPPVLRPPRGQAGDTDRSPTPPTPGPFGRVELGRRPWCKVAQAEEGGGTGAPLCCTAPEGCYRPVDVPGGHMALAEWPGPCR